MHSSKSKRDFYLKIKGKSWKQGYRLNRWILPEISQLEGGTCKQKWTLKLYQTISIFHYKQQRNGPETNLLQSRPVTLIPKIATGILRGTRCSVTTIICAKQYVNPTNFETTMLGLENEYGTDGRTYGRSDKPTDGWTTRRLLAPPMFLLKCHALVINCGISFCLEYETTNNNHGKFW